MQWNVSMFWAPIVLYRSRFPDYISNEWKERHFLDFCHFLNRTTLFLLHSINLCAFEICKNVSKQPNNRRRINLIAQWHSINIAEFANYIKYSEMTKCGSTFQFTQSKTVSNFTWNRLTNECISRMWEAMCEWRRRRKLAACFH